MLTLTPLQDIPLVKAGDDLVEMILASLEKGGLDLRSGDILVLAQKIVSKAEGRQRNLKDVVPSDEALSIAEVTEKDPRLIELILQESNSIVRTRAGLIIAEHHLGFVCANAGIDHSNVPGDDDSVLLLPEAPDKSAGAIRESVRAKTGCEIGVLIIDSHGRAWRLGTVGAAIGISGLPGLVDMRGKPDLFDYELRVTTIGAADELAAAASLVMGQAAEGTPVIHVRGFPYPLREGTLQELIRPRELDLFR